MNQHIDIWIDAYLDNQLNENQTARFEKHLEACPACLVLLEERKQLSNLLQNFVTPESSQTTQQFVDQINLLLPRIQRKPSKKRSSGNVWIIISIGLLAAHTFVQVIHWLSNLILIIPGVDQLVAQVIAVPTFLERAFPWLNIFIIQWSTFSGWGFFYSSLTFTSIALTGYLALIYLAWLVVWWDNQFNNKNNHQTLINKE